MKPKLSSDLSVAGRSWGDSARASRVECRGAEQSAAGSWSRRAWLERTACGFGALAAWALAQQDARAVEGAASKSAGLGSVNPSGPHFPPRAKRAIFLFMQGGVSQVDSFDYKPLLTQRDGEMRQFADARVAANTGQAQSTHRVLKSPWKFRQYGESGKWVSELFPHTARHIDRLCLIHSLRTEGVAHGPATLFLHCGSATQARPSLGAWLNFGLGTENSELPGFISLAPSIGNGGPRNYGPAFLPAAYQGTPLGQAGATADELTIRHLSGGDEPRGIQRRKLDLLEQLNRAQGSTAADDSRLDAVLASYELAWRMQSRAPGVLNFAEESADTLAMYGIGQEPTDSFGRKCLLARRLSEAGVRFVQVNYGDNSANPAWDQHSNLPKHADHARAVDQPIGALLSDLEQRGLLEDTLVWWGGEFGRTPYAEKNGTGRDHNPGGFTVWLAGGGVRAGCSWGATDEFGHLAVEQPVHMHDLHATILHQLGLDHERLTYRHAGRDYRLTDVHGQVIREII